jgi:cytochrome P450 monooxygenase
MGYKLRFIGSFLVILSVYYFWKALRLRTVRKSFEKQYGCQKPAKFRHKDPFLGSDFFNDTKENIKKSRALENWSDRFAKYGSTFSVNLLGSPGICTLEPSNVQTVLATNFKDYGLQQLRRSATLPFLGEGIFTMDGAFWQHSRNLMRPTFTKTNVANLAAFEINLQRFFLLVPEDGSTVDLKPLLRRLVRVPQYLHTGDLQEAYISYRS